MKKWFAVLAFLLAGAFAASALAAFEPISIASIESLAEEVPPCTGLWIDDNYYKFYYEDCGKERSGRGNDAVWALFEEYAQALADTEYFEMAHHEDRGSIAQAYCLRYTGPGELPHPFGVYDQPEVFAIVVGTLGGEAYVMYSVDLPTHDQAETMARFGKTPPVPGEPAGEGDCTICGGTGKCYKCHGSGYIYKTVLVDGKHETAHVRCDGYLCTSGLCMSCGGDGII